MTEASTPSKLTLFNSENGLRTFLCENDKAIREFGKGYEKAVVKFRRERTIERILDLKRDVAAVFQIMYVVSVVSG